MSQAKELPATPGSEQLNGLMLPMAGDPLLVPMSAVAEVIACEEYPDSRNNVDPRVYGWINWRKVAIPLLSYEAALGDEVEPLTAHTRVAVINAVGPAADLGFYGIRLRDFPSPVRITDAEQLQGAEEENVGQARLIRVRLDDTDMEIPNFDFLESICASVSETAQP